MELQRIVIRPGEDQILVDGEPFSRSSLLHQLERLVESRHFRNSKRYPLFLRFVVEQTLSGSTDGLKERTLGVEVFGRPTDYDTNADPIVRVTAGEVRKRLAQYYQEPVHDAESRIELPLGTYVPRFAAHFAMSAALKETGPAEEATGEVMPAGVRTPPEATSILLPASAPESKVAVLEPRFRHRWPVWVLLAAVCALCFAALGWWVRARRMEAGLSELWQPVLSSPAPALVVIGVHTLDRQGNEEQIGTNALPRKNRKDDMLTSMVRSDMVPISDLVSYSRVTDLLTGRAHPYTTRGSADATLEEVRRGPLILIGGLDNLWTLRMTARLRFRFESNGQVESAIVDREHPGTVWRFDNLQQTVVDTTDYAIVASYYDSTIDQPVLIVAGVGKAGTEVAAEFATSNQDLALWIKEAGIAPHKNVEVVLSTEILDGKAGPPRVVASTTW